MVKKNFLKSSLIIAIAVAMMLPIIPTISLAAVEPSGKPSITYSAHMQTYGWDKLNQKPGDALKDEAKNFAGVTGQSKRMEALEVNMASIDGVTLEYRAHVQGEGWMPWTKVDDRAGHTATVGTTGKSLRVEALQLSVKGLNTKGWSILYRAHVQGKGWMDWVDAADPTAFAGTTGSSLRMEAFEIVVVPENEFYYLDNHNGTHTNSYTGETTDCIYGDYTVEGQNFTKVCALCGYSNGETKSLQGVLTDAQLDGQSKVTLESVDLSEETDGLKIPEGMTLEVTDTLDTGNGKDVEVYGHLIAKSITDTNGKLKCKEDGVITFSGLYEDEGDLTKNLTIAKKENVVVDKIVMEKGSEDQDLGATFTLTDKVDLTLDLNGTTVTSSATTSQDAIVNQGKLTINDGIIDVAKSDGIRSYGDKSELVVNNCTIEGEAERAISIGKDNKEASTTQVATITDTKITTTGNTSDSWGIGVFGNNAKVTMKNVELNTTSNGIYTNGKFKDINFVAEKVTVNSEATAVYFAASGDYTFKNSTIKGLDGIEYTGGKLTLNSTTVEATRTKSQNLTEITLTGNGNGTFTGNLNGNGEDQFGAGVMLKVNAGYSSATKESTFTMDSASKVTSEYGPGLLVAYDVEGFNTKNVGLYYTTNTVSGYTKDSDKSASVVWAHKNA